jgi:hypothetical protein
MLHLVVIRTDNVWLGLASTAAETFNIQRSTSNVEVSDVRSGLSVER